MICFLRLLFLTQALRQQIDCTKDGIKYQIGDRGAKPNCI